MKRVVLPETLDELDPSDPQAVRSRVDLVWINRLMGSQGWMLNQLKRLAPSLDTVIELGAGEGQLIAAIQKRVPQLRYIGCDLLLRPEGLSDSIEWVEGDIMESIKTIPLNDRTAVLANLFLHHLEPEQLERFGQETRNASLFLALEPDRSLMSLWLGRCLLPFVGAVTRNDMMISIRAGFQSGELARHFGRENAIDYTWLGGRRMLLR